MPFDPVTGPDYARLTSVANNSAFQTDYNAVYQSLIGLMNGLKKFQDVVTANFNNSAFGADVEGQFAARAPIKIVEVDVSAGPASVSLVDQCSIVGGLVIFKDYTGNAGGNAITLVGDVEGVTDPQITTNFGIFRAYLSAADGLFHTW